MSKKKEELNSKEYKELIEYMAKKYRENVPEKTRMKILENLHDYLFPTKERFHSVVIDMRKFCDEDGNLLMVDEKLKKSDSD